MTSAEVKRLAHECGFELAGIARGEPNVDVERYLEWVAHGRAGAMSYLADRRAGIRTDPRQLLPTARSIVCVGKLYNVPKPHSTAIADLDVAWISRYAWGDDYHAVLRRGLERLAGLLAERAVFDYKICVDTAPLLERSYARDAGLGWIGRNSCLINQYAGSWIFLGELLVSLELVPDSAAADRCGSCTRCIDACPTSAFVRLEDGSYALDSRLCISYFTIELHGGIPETQREGIGSNVFGCDICQDVCPWNSRAAMTIEPSFAPRMYAPALETLAALSEQDFRELFRASPVERARYSGFLRNVTVAMGNTRSMKYREPLERLAANSDGTVAEHARWALSRLE